MLYFDCLGLDNTPVNLQSNVSFKYVVTPSNLYSFIPWSVTPFSSWIALSKTGYIKTRTERWRDYYADGVERCPDPYIQQNLHSHH